MATTDLPRCAKCSEEFRPARRKDQKFCSTKCHDAFWIAARTAAREPRPLMPPGKCVCGKEFQRHPRERRPRRFCSDDCRNAGPRAAAEKLRQEQRAAIMPACVICGKLCKRIDVEACSFKCSRELANQRHPGGHHRRAERHGGKFERGINPLRVFDRDGWHCQICGRATPKRWRGTKHREAPELDHIVPLKLGGSHTWENVQCACRGCNRSKAAKRIVGQLPLFARPEV